jgi:hypothetical protein
MAQLSTETRAPHSFDVTGTPCPARVINRALCGVLAGAVAALAIPHQSHAATVNSLGAVTLGADGQCNAGTPTQFSFNIDVTGDTDDGGIDHYSRYLVDSNNTVLQVTANTQGFGSTSFFAAQLSTLVTPAPGDLRIVIYEDTDNTPAYAQGTTATFVPGSILAQTTFDANALDPDCPVIFNPTSQIESQQQAGSTAMSHMAGQNVATGVSSAIGEAFRGSHGPSFSGSYDNGLGSGSAYMSLRGMRTPSQERLNRRVAISNGTYQPARAGSSTNHANAQAAIASAFPSADASSTATAGEGSDLMGYGTYADPLVHTETSHWNAWIRGSFSHFDGDAFSGDAWNGIAGVDYRLSDAVLLGALAGYEVGDFEFSSTNGAFDGEGFTTGAYVGVKISENLVMDAFITHSWLGYDNRAGTATGETDATRLMLSMNLTGRHDLTTNLVVEPNIRVFYAHESQDGYSLSDATAIGENTIDSGRVSLGPTFRYRIPHTASGQWSLKASVHGEYDLSSETQTSTALPDFDGLVSARLGLGVDGTLLNGWMISLDGDVGGLGSGSFTSYTGTAKLRMPLN